LAYYNNVGKDVNLENVTITQNTAVASGGIMNVTSTFMLQNVTMIGNTGSAGNEEMNIYGSTVTVKNSIIWSHSDHQDFILSGAESTIIATNSIIRQPEGTIFPGEGNINNDPLVGDLVDTGGFLKVLPLLSNSPAIDAGSNVDCLSTDQRGVKRPQGVYCDIGAYEVFQGQYKNYLPTVSR
jgi:hypothetical protein